MEQPGLEAFMDVAPEEESPDSFRPSNPLHDRRGASAAAERLTTLNRGEPVLTQPSESGESPLLVDRDSKASRLAGLV